MLKARKFFRISASLACSAGKFSLLFDPVEKLFLKFRRLRVGFDGAQGFRRILDPALCQQLPKLACSLVAFARVMVRVARIFLNSAQFITKSLP